MSQVDPVIYTTPLKELHGLAWLLARHKISLDRREFNHLERQKKRQKNQVGVCPCVPSYIDLPVLEPTLAWDTA